MSEQNINDRNGFMWSKLSIFLCIIFFLGNMPVYIISIYSKYFNYISSLLTLLLNRHDKRRMKTHCQKRSNALEHSSIYI